MEPVMYLKKVLRLPGTLAFRLTLWYAGIFTILTLVAFLALYFVISTVLNERRDQDFLDDVKGYSSTLATEGMDRVKSEVAWEAASDGPMCKIMALISHVHGACAHTHVPHDAPR